MREITEIVANSRKILGLMESNLHLTATAEMKNLVAALEAIDITDLMEDHAFVAEVKSAVFSEANADDDADLF